MFFLCVIPNPLNQEYEQINSHRSVGRLSHPRTHYSVTRIKKPQINLTQQSLSFRSLVLFICHPYN